MNKKNLILGGILVALIAIAYLYQGPIKNWKEKIGVPDNILAGLNIDEINKIDITSPEESIVLEKIGDKWKIGGTKEFYLKDDLINNVISELKNAVDAEVEVVSENIDKKNEFNTDDESGMTIKLISGEEEKKVFVVGKLAGNFTDTYISESGIEKTYSIKSDLKNIFSNDWYDKTIFSSEKEKLNKIRFQYPTREFTIEKIDDEWTGVLPYKFSVKEEKIDEILNIMSNLSASDIPTQTFEGSGLENHIAIIQATGEEIDNTLMIGGLVDEAEEKENLLYHAKRGDSDNIYIINNEEKEELDKKIWELR